MRQIFGILFIAFLLNSCAGPKPNSSDFYNAEHYDISVGDTLRIYYTTNSCCYYCLPRKSESPLLEFIGEEIVVSSDKDCDGCSATYALLFVAKTPGTVELKGRIVAASQGCVEGEANWEKFTIHISE